MSGAVSGLLGSAQRQIFFIFPDARQADVGESAIKIRDIEGVKVAVPDFLAAVPAGGRCNGVSPQATHTHGSTVAADSDVTFDRPSL